MLSLIALISRPAASCGGTGHDDLQSGDMREVDSTLCECVGPARSRAPNGARIVTGIAITGAVMVPCHHVDDGVERARDEVGELVLDDRAQTDERRARCQAREPGFRDRRVDHPPRSELLQEALRHLEGAAELADVFADQEDVGVRLHLGHHRRTDGLEIGHSACVGFSRHRHLPPPCSRQASDRRAPSCARRSHAAEPFPGSPSRWRR